MYALRASELYKKALIIDTDRARRISIELWADVESRSGGGLLLSKVSCIFVFAAVRACVRASAFAISVVLVCACMRARVCALHAYGCVCALGRSFWQNYLWLKDTVERALHLTCCDPLSQLTVKPSSRGTFLAATTAMR